MQLSDRLNHLEQTSSFLLNHKKLPTFEQIRSVREEIFDEINEVRTTLNLMTKNVNSLELILNTIYRERNTNV